MRRSPGDGAAGARLRCRSASSVVARLGDDDAIGHHVDLSAPFRTRVEPRARRSGSRSPALLQLAEQVVDLVRGMRVEPLRRLVEQQDRRPAARARGRSPRVACPSGEDRPRTGRPHGHTDLGKQLSRRIARFRGRRVAVLEQRELDVLHGADPRDERRSLEHDAEPRSAGAELRLGIDRVVDARALEIDPPASTAARARRCGAEHRLAGVDRPDHEVRRAARHRDRHVVNDRRVHRPGEVLDAEHPVAVR